MNISEDTVTLTVAQPVCPLNAQTLPNSAFVLADVLLRSPQKSYICIRACSQRAFTLNFGLNHRVLHSQSHKDRR